MIERSVGLSGSGLDGIKPILIQQMLSKEASETGKHLLQTVTRLVNPILAGRISHYVQRALFGASFCALKKKDGGISHIAVGIFYRYLAGRIVAKHVAINLDFQYSPFHSTWCWYSSGM